MVFVKSCFPSLPKIRRESGFVIVGSLTQEFIGTCKDKYKFRRPSQLYRHVLETKLRSSSFPIELVSTEQHSEKRVKLPQHDH